MVSKREPSHPSIHIDNIKETCHEHNGDGQECEYVF